MDFDTIDIYIFDITATKEKEEEEEGINSAGNIYLFNKKKQLFGINFILI
jgi:hypothetical protein